MKDHKKKNVHLMFGDCLNRMPEIKDASVDLILCDPPYGTTQNDWDSLLDFKELWKQYDRVIKPNGAILVFAQSPFDKLLGCSNLKHLRYEWIWEKTTATGHLNAKKMPMKAHETILVFYKKLPTYNPQKTSGHKPANSFTNKHAGSNYGKTTKEISGGGNTDRYPRSVLIFPTDRQKSALHPTQKPVALLEYMIKTYSNEGETVLDNTMGSASTIIACMNLNRKAIGIEKSEKFYPVALERVSTHLPQRSALEIAVEDAVEIESEDIAKFVPHFQLPRPIPYIPAHHALIQF